MLAISSIYGLGAGRESFTNTSAASDPSSKAGASTSTPVYVCSLQTTTTNRMGVPSTEMVCAANDTVTTAMFKAVGKFLNVAYDKSGLFGAVSSSLIQQAVKTNGITWASEKGVINQNTAQLFRAFVAAGVNVGQGIDTANDQKYIAANAPRIVEAISRRLASVGINLPVPDFTPLVVKGRSQEEEKKSGSTTGRGGSQEEEKKSSTTPADNGQTHTTTTTDTGGGGGRDQGSTWDTERNRPKPEIVVVHPESQFGLTDLLIVLGLVGAGTGAYFLFRKKKPKAGVAGARSRRPRRRR
jgi:hypothetical protein